MPSKTTSKFAGMIPRDLPEENTTPVVVEETKDVVPAKRRGRPLKKNAIYGKEGFSSTNFVANQKAYWAAHARLKQEDPKKTMSHLINEFLERYSKRKEDH